MQRAIPGPLLVYFRSFQTQLLQKKTLDVSGIRTRIVGVEGQDADHLTSTTAPNAKLFMTLGPDVFLSCLSSLYLSFF